MEKLIPYIYLCMFAFGLFCLFHFGSRVDPPHISPKDLAPALIGEPVSVNGIVIAKTESPKVTTLVLWNQEKLKIPLFFPADVQVGQNLTVRGKVTLYRGSMEVIPFNQHSLRLEQSNPIYLSSANISRELLYRQVALTGRIVRLNSYPAGDLIFLRDHAGTAKLFSHTPTGLKKGDSIQATGMVSLYEGSTEVILTDFRRL